MINRLETERLLCQATADSTKSKAERNKLGQFATPPELARQIVKIGLDYLGKEDSIRFLDPALGTGAFYSALLKERQHSIKQAIGYEIDPVYSASAATLWASHGLDVRTTDFTTAAPQKVSFIVCNPPYVRHHHLRGDQKRDLAKRCLESTAIPINGLSGLYCYFIGIAHSWMEKDAVAVWLIPSEFMDVNYGEVLKRYLLEKVTLLRIHRFDSDDVQFADALVSSAVVFFRNTPPNGSQRIAFTTGGALTTPTLTRSVHRNDITASEKWGRLGVLGVSKAFNGLTVGDVFLVKRGVATGANDFFIMSEEKAMQLGLPERFLRPILPSPRYVKNEVVEADERGHPVLSKQVLLDCNISEEAVQSKYPALWRYLTSPQAEQIKNRYLCSKRTPWYLQERRPAPPILCTYLGRADTESGRPFRFIRNRSMAITANVFLMLYPKPAIENALKSDPALIDLIWRELKNINVEEMIHGGRVYGGGLHKLEPRELANLVLPRALVSRISSLISDEPWLIPEHKQNGAG